MGSFLATFRYAGKFGDGGGSVGGWSRQCEVLVMYKVKSRGCRRVDGTYGAPQ